MKQKRHAKKVRCGGQRKTKKWITLIGIGLLQGALTCLIFTSCTTPSSSVSGTPVERGLTNTGPSTPSSTSQPAKVKLGKWDPSHPSGVKWADNMVGDIDEGISLRSTDPVSAILTFMNARYIKNKELDQRQRDWLDQQITELEPGALEILRTDYETALTSEDFYGSVVTGLVANKIKGGFTTPYAPRLESVRNALFGGPWKGPRVWRVTEVRAERLDGAYTEAGLSPFDKNRLTLTPPNGYELIRVKATLENISSQEDKTYALWACHDIQRVISKLQCEKASHPFRWLVPNYFFVMSPDGRLVPSFFSTKGWSSRVTFNEGKDVFWGCEPVSQGHTLSTELLFSVPKGINGLRLLVMGAPSVPLAFP